MGRFDWTYRPTYCIPISKYLVIHISINLKYQLYCKSTPENLFGCILRHSMTLAVRDAKRGLFRPICIKYFNYICVVYDPMRLYYWSHDSFYHQLGMHRFLYRCLHTLGQYAPCGGPTCPTQGALSPKEVLLQYLNSWTRQYIRLRWELHYIIQAHVL